MYHKRTPCPIHALGLWELPHVGTRPHQATSVVGRQRRAGPSSDRLQGARRSGQASMARSPGTRGSRSEFGIGSQVGSRSAEQGAHLASHQRMGKVDKMELWARRTWSSRMGMQHPGSRQKLTQSHDGRRRVPGQGVRDEGGAREAGVTQTPSSCVTVCIAATPRRMGCQAPGGRELSK